MTKEDVSAKVQSDLSKYLVVNEKDLLVETTISFYEIITFGLGKNHGGTVLFVSYGLPKNPLRSFSALDSKKAIDCANLVALKRGDLQDVNTFRPLIKCYMPEIKNKIKQRKIALCTSS